jgi:outer membrane protein assembly complex protein YaeT
MLVAPAAAMRPGLLPTVGLVLTVSVAPACHEDLGIGEATGEQVEVASLTFEGVEAIDQSRLKKALATRASSRLPWGRTRYFNRDAFEADLKRIEAFYDDHGYPDARVLSHDIDVDESGRKVRIHIAISEGEPVRVASMELSGFDELPRGVRERLLAEMPLQPGEPVVQQRLVESGEKAANALKDHGYPFAQIGIDRREADERQQVVTFEARPGQKSYFGPIEITGNTSVSDEVIRRELAYKPGQVFGQNLLRESLRRLYALELFEFANTELVRSETPTAEVPTRVTVTEGDHQRVLFSFGYGTEEKLRGEAEWRHVNFLGDARTLGVHGKWSWLDRGVEGTFVQPYVFRPELSLALKGQTWYVSEPAFRAVTRGGSATLTYEFGAGTGLSLVYTNQFQSSRIVAAALEDPELRDELIALGLDPTTGVQEGALAALGVNLSTQRVDAALDPTRGFGLTVNLEQAGSWLPGTYNYVSAVTEGRAYYSPIESLTLAARARYGSIDPFGAASNIPFFKRYFLGGASSLRGWGRFEVAPLSGSGLPIGGNSLFEATAEVRTRPLGNLGLVAFLDAGNVWPGAWDLRSRDLLIDAGPGLRYTTPIGPVRFDFAYQLNTLEGLRIDGRPQRRRWRIHFSIGQAF